VFKGWKRMMMFRDMACDLDKQEGTPGLVLLHPICTSLTVLQDYVSPDHRIISYLPTKEPKRNGRELKGLDHLQCAMDLTYIISSNHQKSQQLYHYYHFHTRRKHSKEDGETFSRQS
jgi:hypothetical protein